MARKENKKTLEVEETVLPSVTQNGGVRTAGQPIRQRSGKEKPLFSFFLWLELLHDTAAASTASGAGGWSRRGHQWFPPKRHVPTGTCLLYAPSLASIITGQLHWDGALGLHPPPCACFVFWEGGAGCTISGRFCMLFVQ